MGSTRSLKGRSTAAKVVLALATILAAVAVLSDLAQLSLVSNIKSGTFVTDAQVNSNDARQGAIAILQLVMLVVAGIFFIRWFHLAFQNAHSFGANGLPASPGWAIGAWFVPFLNLVRPKQIADAIWKVGEPSLQQPLGESWKEKAVPGFVHWWWALWLGSSIVGTISANVLQNADTFGQIEFAAQAQLVSDVALVVSGFLAWMLVDRATSRQQTLTDRGAQLSPASSVDPGR